MHRKDIGWIGFEWGKPGDPPPEFKNDVEALKWWKDLKNKYLLFKGGKGISHIIAKRDWEGKWIKEFIGQKGIDVAFKLIEVIAKGRKEGGGDRLHIAWKNYIAYLSRPEKWEKDKKREEYWLLSGFKIEKEGYQFILESADENGGKVKPPLNASPFQDPAYHSYASEDYWYWATNGSRELIEQNINKKNFEVNPGWLYDL